MKKVESPVIKNVILVDYEDQEIGVMEKMEAHQKGLLHRAFSVFVFNSNDELLLQKRALGKYHSEDLWTNTCCSHPAPGESILVAASRRLEEEMNYTCELWNTFKFIYKVNLDRSMIEHELDHVVIGKSDQNPVLNPEEASDYRWISLGDVKKDVENDPEKYTNWFKIIINERFEELINALKKINEGL